MNSRRTTGMPPMPELTGPLCQSVCQREDVDQGGHRGFPSYLLVIFPRPRPARRCG